MAETTDRITVLLVDDEENILKSLRRLLMDEDFDIETAVSGEAGLQKVQSLENLGLIVSDQRMPGMNGTEFLYRSREFAPNAQRILLTGYSDINATIEAINKGGASRYITKPWDDDDLSRAIRTAVEHYRTESEKRGLNEIIARQKQELEEWNQALKKRLLQSTATIREQSQQLKTVDKLDPLATVHRAFDGFLEVMGDRLAVHARTVCALVTDVVRAMGLDTGTVAACRIAALLHDAGKFGNLTADLNKSLDAMSESEASEYRQHTLRGVEMFRNMEELSPVLPMIRHHHEAYNGSGFPDGLVEDAIPLGARLIAIADFIDKSARSVDHSRADFAMMTARYYSGTLLDPQLIPKFRNIARAVYMERGKTSFVDEVEIDYNNLAPGMTIARDVLGANGVLLLQRGKVVDKSGVMLIKSHFNKNPPQHGIFIQIVEDMAPA